MASFDSSTVLSDALVILGAAGIVIPAFARLRVSPVIGFILVGVLVGPHGLGALQPRLPWLYHVTISDPHGVEPVAEFGIVLLLFAIGLELSFRRLWEMRRQVFGLGVAELLLSGTAIAGALVLLGQNRAGAVGLGLALALSSTALVLPLAGTTSAVGRAAFAMLLFEDLALVPIIFGLSALGPDQGGWQAMAWTLLKGGITVLVLLVAGRVALPPLFAQAARTKSPELFLSVSLLTVILASLATATAGLSPIVGALIAGLLIAETEYRTEVEIITAPFRGLALGVFLITVGMRLDLAAITGAWQQLALAIAGVVIAKTLITGALLRLSGLRRGIAAEVATMMAAPSETTLIVLAAAEGAGLIGGPVAAFWQSVTAIGLTITPLLAALGHALAKRVERREAREADRIDRPERRVVLIGFGRVGRTVATMLRAHDRPFIAVDADIDSVSRGRRDGFPVVFGDASRPAMVAHLALERAEAVVLTMDDPVGQLRLTRVIRADHPDLPIIARARDAAHAAALYRAGATDAVPEQLESSLQLSEAVLTEIGVPVGPVIASIHDKRAEQRASIKDMGGLAEAPRERGRRLRDA
ncbi:cation:proton antiporter domain-containing protein [Sphingomonas morindae]|uniref:Cation:proton antiporter n=1 Tax=Sphingomonas morindae TaxID=1541170 RepID=A0ABY4X6F2_9SPHN|nr:cation:proton antiporter [Sphingomonas morindae]USI72493.1 cation:proton antiporter [Sphingomonas morindae]